MLLPNKHVTLAESLLGLGAFVLRELERPRTVDQLYERMVRAREDRSLPAFHDFDSLVLATAFLYALGAIQADTNGAVRRCA